jgi:predicted RNA-binding protein YlqC (UPF0109 family)
MTKIINKTFLYFSILKNNNLKIKVMENKDLIGKYVNQRLYTDINPVGKIIGTRGKTILIVKRVMEVKQTKEMEFVSGGFAGICINQEDQEWAFEEVEDVFEVKMNKQWGRRGQMYVADKPRMYYDYNF